MKQHQVILHIGQTKTGTTSIQDFLHTNQANLEGSDIYYTQRPEKYTSHRYLFHLINVNHLLLQLPLETFSEVV